MGSEGGILGIGGPEVVRVPSIISTPYTTKRYARFAGLSSDTSSLSCFFLCLFIEMLILNGHSRTHLAFFVTSLLSLFLNITMMVLSYFTLGHGSTGGILCAWTERLVQVGEGNW